jgi:hypothetical protein
MLAVAGWPVKAISLQVLGIRVCEAGEADAIRHRRAFRKDDYRVRSRPAHRLKRLVEFRARSERRLPEGTPE